MKLRPEWAFVPCVLGMSLVAGCNLDQKGLETSIRDKAKSEGLELKKVECPKRKMKEGDTFDCTAETSDDDDIVFHVTQKDAAGNVSWKLQGTILDTKKIGDGIESKIGRGADVKCPEKATVLVKGKKIKCDATIEGKEHHVQITAEDDEGQVEWKILD